MSTTEKGVEFWDAHAARRVRLLDAPRAVAAVFSPDGRSLFTSGASGLQLWPIEDSSVPLDQLRIGPPETLLPTDTERFELAANSPVLALDRGFKDAVLFNLESRDIPGPPCWHLHLDHVLITPDARWMVTTTWKGQGIRVWDAKKCEFARDLVRDVGSATPAFSPDGRWLAVSDGFAYYLWEVGTWRLVYRIEREHPDGWPGPVAFSPDGRLLAVPHTRYIAQLIEAQSGRTVGVLEAPTSSSLSGYGFSADGRFLAVAETENIQLWDLNAIHEQLKSMQIAWEVESHAR
jgi:WD40 repeat protein